MERRHRSWAESAWISHDRCDRIPDVKKGDQVSLIGRDGDEFISIEEMGDLSGRFSYEFACEISDRVPRVYIKDGKETEKYN